ncbi:MAG: beta strand repeat-containing protein [Bdellovibrio sp.]
MAQPIRALSSGVTYTGKILDSNDVPVTANSVIFTVTIYDPAGKCWLYSEQRNLDLSQTAGTFSFEIGSGDLATLYGAAPSFNNSASGGPKNIADLFSNRNSFTGLGNANGCTGSYDPTTSTDPNEGRLLAVAFRVGASGADQVLPPMRITPVPLAMQALAVNGYGTGELLKVDQSTVTNSGINNNPLSVSQYTEFWSLVNKSSNSYLPSVGDIGIVAGNNKINNLLGQALPTGPATNGQVLVSNGTSWTLQAMSGGGGSVTSVTGTSPISVGGTATAPVISLPAASTSVNGYLSSADWNTFNSKQSSSLSSGNIFVGNASGVATGVSLSGDATINNTGALTLKNTGTAGTYGSGSLIPIITTDAQGRITGVTTLAPLDATKLPLAGGTMTGALDMGSQDITNAGNISMAASKTLGLSSNASDPATPSAGQVWYNSTSNVIKYYDGSSVKSLGTSSGASQWITTGTDIYYNTGKVGIGTTIPTYPLEIRGLASEGLKISTQGSTTTAPLISLADTTRSVDAVISSVNPAGTTNGLYLGTNSTHPVILGTAGNEYVRINGVNGNVGIGTTNPGSSLDVKGTLRLSGSSSGYVGFAPAAAAGSTTYTLPTTQGTAGQVLSTDGVAGNATLSWSTPSPNLPGLASAQVWVGNASGVATAISLSGDISSVSNTGSVTVDKTQTAVANKILQLDASSVAVTKGIDIGGGGTGKVSFRYPSSATSTTLTFPNTAGSLNQFLQTDGSGNLTWATPSPVLPGLASAQVWVGDASGVATAVSFSGDISSVTNAGVVTVNKTTTAQANKLLSLDGSGVATSMGNQLNGTTGSVTLQATGATTTYSLTFPAAQGAAGQTLSNNGSGSLSWITPLTSSTGFVNGGNSFAANSSLGTNDNFNLDLKTNNTSRMTISNAGSIGIGTTSPAYTLDVNGSISGNIIYTQNGNVNVFGGVNHGIVFDDSGGDTDYWISRIDTDGDSGTDNDLFQIGKGTVIGTTPFVTVNNTGNVGIGTTSPQENLHIFSTATAGAQALIASDGTNANQESAVNLLSKSNGTDMLGSATAKGWEIFTKSDAYGIVSMKNALDFAYWNGSSWGEMLFLRADGNVGVGTTAPSGSIHVKRTTSADADIRYDSGSVFGEVYASTSSSIVGFGSVSNNDIIFETNDTEKARITKTGEVGIGTTIPTAVFHVAKAGTASMPGVRIDGSWFTGGTSTTTEPQLLIEPAGTASTAWSTAGTGLGVNAGAGFTGNLIDAQLNGVSKFKVDSTGKITGDGSGLSNLGTAQIPAAARIQVCEIVIGDPGAASPALADDNDNPAVCGNKTGAAMTITAVECYADAGSPTVTPVFTGGGAILTGALTCGNGSFASGTLSGTPTQANGASIDANITTAGGTAKYIVIRITRTL